MKKILQRTFQCLLVFAVFMGLAVAPMQTSAQVSSVTDYEKAFNEYILSLEEYEDIHDEYGLTRSQYLKFRTLTSRNNAREATAEMLAARDDVVVKYLAAIRERLLEVSGINEGARSRVIAQLNEEISWFEGHKESLVGAGSLEDLVSDSLEAKKRYGKLGPVIYEALSLVPYGRITRFQERLEENFLAVKDKVATIRSEDRGEYQLSKEKLESIDNWVFETEERISRGNAKYDTVQEIIDTIPVSRQTFASSSKKYNQVLARLGLTMQDYRDTSLSIREITREIKTE